MSKAKNSIKIIRRSKPKKTHQFQNIAAAIVLTIIIGMFIAASVVYFWQKASLKTAENTYKSEIFTLKNQISDMKGKLVTEEEASESQDSNPDPMPVKTDTTPDVEFAFNNCGFITSFVYEDWYPGLRDELAKVNIKPADISSACYSEKGSMVAVIAQTGVYCEGPRIYKFNTDTNTFGGAKVVSKGVSCLATIEAFGRRDGAVINTNGERTDENCTYKDYFKYNYGKNSLKLTATRSKCGSEEWKTTEY